jgi:nucleosome binding factor SPN SPT16 subunit
MQVDEGKECMLLPMYGVMVPFHVTTIKSATTDTTETTGTSHSYIRVTFNTGGAGYEPAQTFPNLIFLKELAFR